MQVTSSHYPKGKMERLVFKGFKEIRVHLQVFRLSVEFLDVWQ
jgi:hypothetical protein